jgi:RIO-like serine/threonine protein kinase
MLLRQNRMSLDVVARPLTSFNSLLPQRIYFHARILHPDICAGNTLIPDDGKGLLIDWDLCVNLGNINNDNKLLFARQPEVTISLQGTVMSAALL